MGKQMTDLRSRSGPAFAVKNEESCAEKVAETFSAGGDTNRWEVSDTIDNSWRGE
jgi:hypothetical protein